jgi:translocation and assembly module TamB
MRRLLAAALIALALLALGAAWLLGTESGLRWSAQAAAAASGGRLSLAGLRGTLAGEIGFDEIRFGDGKTDLRLVGGELRLDLLAVLGGQAAVRSLRAEQLLVSVSKDEGSRPRTAPVLPIGLRIENAEIARVRLNDFAIENFDLSETTIRRGGAVSGAATLAVREGRYPVRVSLQVSGTLERLEAMVSATAAEVPISAKLLLAPFAERPLQALEARAGPADLSTLQPDWPRTALALELHGKAGTADALAGTLALRNALPGPLDRQRAPLATLDARFRTDFASLALDELRITGAGTLSGGARIEPGQARLELRAADLDLRALRSTLRRTRLSGPLTVVASEKTQSVQGTLAQDDMRLSVDAVRAGDQVEVRHLRAEAAGGQASGSGRLHLGQPVRFEADLAFARFDPARFGDYPAGSINGRLQASGTLQANFSVDARWTVADSTLLGAALTSRGSARILRQRLARGEVEARLGEAQLTASGAFGGPRDELVVRLEVPDVAQFVEQASGRLNASGRLSGTWDNPRGRLRAEAANLRLPRGLALASVTAEADGTLDRHEAELQVKAEGLDLAARLRGAWRAPQGWTGELYVLRNSGAYPLELTQPAALSLAPRRLELGRLQARLGAGQLLIQKLSWSEARLASSGRVRGLPAQWLILAGGLAERASASLLVDGEWDLAAAPEVTGSLTLRRNAGDIALLPDHLALGLEKAELQAKFAGGGASATATIASKYGSAEIRGMLQGFAEGSPLDFTAQVRFAELRTLLQPFVEGARVDGRLTAELRGTGTLGKVSLAGSLQGDALALQVPPYGIFLKEGELRAQLEGDRVRVTRFSIGGSQGRFTASGTLPLRGGEDAHVDWRAEDFGLLARPDLRLTVSGAGEARLAGRRVSLSGALRAERGYLELERNPLPQLGDDVVVAGKERLPGKQAARVPVALDVQLDLGEHLEVRGYGLEGRLTGKLQVETTKDGELRAYGRIEAVNATFLAYGQRLQVDPGIAIFDGPLDNPSLQLTAWRRNQQVEAGVQISGTARAPRVQLVSQPPVPEGERLSWLVLGRAPGEATKADLGLLQAAAGALLARGDQLPLDRRIARAFGVDEISLRGSGEVGDRVVAVGKRLSDRLYVSYEHGLGVVASTLVKLDLALTQRWSVRAETGTSSGVGLFYRFSWD